MGEVLFFSSKYKPIDLHWLYVKNSIFDVKFQYECKVCLWYVIGARVFVRNLGTYKTYFH